VGEQLKDDMSPVTELDLFVSNLIKENFSSYLDQEYTFFSEEDFDSLKDKSIILDPIDGTKEFIAGIPQCAC
jgi:fructose-1,6-bisphosphatase/inositol monophosphatase family enzyme